MLKGLDLSVYEKEKIFLIYYYVSKWRNLGRLCDMECILEIKYKKLSHCSLVLSLKFCWENFVHRLEKYSFEKFDFKVFIYSFIYTIIKDST